MERILKILINVTALSCGPLTASAFCMATSARTLVKFISDQIFKSILDGNKLKRTLIETSITVLLEAELAIFAIYRISHPKEVNSQIMIVIAALYLVLSTAQTWLSINQQQLTTTETRADQQTTDVASIEL